MAALSGAFANILSDVGRHLARVQKSHESEVAYLRDQVRKLQDQDREGIPCEVVPTAKPPEEGKKQTIDVEPKSEPTQLMQVANTATCKSKTNERHTAAELNIMRQATSKGTGLTEIPMLVKDGSSPELALAEKVTEVSEGLLGDVPDFDHRHPETDYKHLAGRAYWAAQLESSKAEVFACSVIVLNTFLMAIEFQYKGLQIAHARGIPGFEAKDDWPYAEEVLVGLEWFFTYFFTIELFIRIVVIQCPFFCKAMNWLDIVVVVVSWLPMKGLHMNPTMARLLRLGRLGRALRMFKFSSVLDCLHLILKSIAASSHVLLWSVLLLLVVQMIAGLFVGQILATWLDDPNTDPDAREAVFAYYGTFTKIFFTMFEVTLANWAVAARLLVDHVGEHWAFFFVFYRCVVGFAVLNVISAIFIQQTLKVAQSDEEVMICQKQRAAGVFAKQLHKLFVALDSSGDGQISWDEFDGILVHPKTKAFMQALEIDVSDLERLYKMLDNGGAGGICIHEFAAGLARVKGAAKSIDLVEMLTKIGRLEVQMNKVHMAREQLAAGKLAEDAWSYFDPGDPVATTKL